MSLALAIAAGACGSDSSTSTTPAAPSCSFSITQPTTTFGPEGGSGTVGVTAASGCAWTATSSATFVTITQGATGSGNGSVTFTVAANTGATDRTATLAVGGSNITITQRAAAAAPTGTLAAPTAKSPVGGVAVDPGTPALVVNNAAATGSVGTVTYRFEVSDQPTFPADPVRTFTQDGVAQGSGSTSWIVNHTLGANVLWYWHARATNGTTTTAYSATETFTTGNTCAFSLSASTAAVASTGGTGSVTVTAAANCAWTAVSNSAFITVTAGASGTGTGAVSYSVAGNSGAARSGTLTIAGQTFTVSQSGVSSSGISASFYMTDPGLSTSPTTECRITSGIATTCALYSTSFPLGTNSLVQYDWTAQWTDGTVQTRTQTGASSSFSFTWTCGGPASTDDGVGKTLAVTLTVTDSQGSTATVSSGSGSQPPLFIRLFKC
jgi:hypothetical protein